MVDTLLYADEKGARSSFTVKAGSVLIKDSFLQEAGIMENIAQTAALHAGYHAAKENKVVDSGYIGSIKNFEVSGLPAINDVLITEIDIEGHIFNVTVLNAKVWLKEKLVASCEMKVFAADREKNE